MLFVQLISILLVAGIQALAAVGDRVPLEVLPSGGNPNTILRPYIGNPVRRDDGADAKVIRGLLTWAAKRQSCPSGYGLCSDGSS